MTRLRLTLLALLFLAPFAVLIGLGSYYLWETGLMWVWWPLLATLGVAYFFAYRWTRPKGVLPDTEVAPPGYWTDRDNLAWEKVKARAASYESVSLDEISNAKHFTDVALALATEVGAVYNPDSEDPFDNLTLPEVLACVELASADLNEMVQKYVPGVHLVRIKDVKRAKKAYGWYKTGQDVYWAGAALLNPLETGMRFLASRGGLGSLMSRIQSNVVLWFHTAFVHQLGHYLIELNSGRLKVGVKRYREILAEHREPPPEDVASRPAPVEVHPEEAGAAVAPVAPAAPATKPITVAVLGAVKAGKSSLVNALLGKQSATVDRLPVGAGTRYGATLPGGQPVSILDTGGYGERVSDTDFAAAVEASREADLILLVTPANNPGRAADVDLLDRLKAWFAERPQLRMPPVVAVVNQVDLLSPKAEWSPPYDWQAGTRPKERNVRDCVAAVREQLGTRAADVVPVCAREGETFGIAEGLVPVAVSHLDHARGTAILKAFDAGAGERPGGKVMDQVGNAVSAGLGALAGWLNKKK